MEFNKKMFGALWVLANREIEDKNLVFDLKKPFEAMLVAKKTGSIVLFVAGSSCDTRLSLQFGLIFAIIFL